MTSSKKFNSFTFVVLIVMTIVMLVFAIFNDIGMQAHFVIQSSSAISGDAIAPDTKTVASNLVVGDYITGFGKWDGRDLRWRVVSTSTNSIMLQTETVLSDRYGNAIQYKYSDPKKPLDYFVNDKIVNNDTDNSDEDENDIGDNGALDIVHSRSEHGTNLWGQSDARAFLNGEFFDAAFDSDEKSVITQSKDTVNFYWTDMVADTNDIQWVAGQTKSNSHRARYTGPNYIVPDWELGSKAAHLDSIGNYMDVSQLTGESYYEAISNNWGKYDISDNVIMTPIANTLDIINNATLSNPSGGAYNDMLDANGISANVWTSMPAGIASNGSDNMADSSSVAQIGKDLTASRSASADTEAAYAPSISIGSNTLFKLVGTQTNEHEGINEHEGNTEFKVFELADQSKLAPIITTDKLPIGTVNEWYDFVIEVNSYDVNFSLNGKLPTGLSLDTKNGRIYGTPTAKGNFEFTVNVGNGQGLGSKDLNITIEGATGAPVITTTDLKSGSVGSRYNQRIEASGDDVVFGYRGKLPNGLELDKDTGHITGTPTTEGQYSFVIDATNDYGDDSASYTVVISPEIEEVLPPHIETRVLPNGKLNVAYRQEIIVSGTDKFDFGIDGDLPPGLEFIDAAGLIFGTPTAVGMFEFTISASNGIYTDKVTYDVEITEDMPPVIETVIFPHGKVGTAYFASIMVRGDNILLTIAGALPTGLELDGYNRTISGTPTQAGEWTFSITASNESGFHTKQYTINIADTVDPPYIKTNTIPTGILYEYYEARIEVDGIGVTMQLAGILPKGLYFDGFSGVISGIPIELGLFKFIVLAKNSAGDDQMFYDLVIDEPPATPIEPKITTTTLDASKLGVEYSVIIMANTTDVEFSMSGELPAGLHFNYDTGEISGIPQRTGEYIFTIAVSNSLGADSVRYTLVVGDDSLLIAASIAGGGIFLLILLITILVVSSKVKNKRSTRLASPLGAGDISTNYKPQQPLNYGGRFYVQRPLNMPQLPMGARYNEGGNSHPRAYGGNAQYGGDLPYGSNMAAGYKPRRERGVYGDNIRRPYDSDNPTIIIPSPNDITNTGESEFERILNSDDSDAYNNWNN